MENEAECVVSGALAGILLFTRCVGMAPLRFDRHENGWRIRISSSLKKLTYVLTTIYYIPVIWALIIDFQDINAIYFTHQLAWTAEVVVTTLKTAPLMCFSSEHMQTMIACINRIKKINVMLKIKNWPQPWNTIQIGILIIWMAFSSVMIVSDFVFYAIIMESVDKSMIMIAMYSTYFLFQWMSQLAVIQFAMIVLYTRTTFKVVNDSFGRLLLDITNARDCRPATKTVRSLCSAYGIACDMVRDVNRSYGLTVLMLLAGTFLHLIVKPYYLIKIIKHIDDSELNQEFKTGRLYWPICSLVNLVMMVEPCNLTHNEIDMTRLMVSRLLRQARSLNDPLAKEMEQFCKSLSLPQAAYIPMNVTKLSRSFILTILSSVTTYLAIVVDV